MTLRAIQRLFARGLLACALLASTTSASAQSRDATAATQTDDQRKAQEHFVRARELYLGGSYKEAGAELEVARKLDPKAKDLVLNLAIVHEKLAKYDDAIVFLHAYLDMDGVTPAERTRAEGMIKRIEGAKQRAPVPPKQSPTPDLVRSPQPGPPPPQQPGPPPHGRWDGYTLGAVVVSGVAIITGASLGLWAVRERPTDFVTGRDGTYASFENKTSSAHHAAIASDVFIGVGIVSAVAAVVLYFARTKDVAPRTGSTTAFPGPGLRAWASPAGGAVGLGGAF